MKKIIIITIIVMLLTLSISGIIYINIKKQQEKELDKHLTLLNFDEFKEKIEKKEDFILIITGSTCSFCEEYLPTFKKVLKDYDLYAFQLHQNLLSENELGYLKNIATTSGTPTVVFIKNGEESNTLNRIYGKRSRSYTIDKLKVNGYIK